MKENLQNFNKKDLKLSDYIPKITLLYDELESIGCIVSKEENPICVLGGLNETFDSVFFFYIKKQCLLRKQL